MAKVGWTKKHCALYNRHGDAYTMHNTRDCQDGTTIKRSLSMIESHSRERETKGTNVDQIIHAECKKALCTAFKRAIKIRKCQNISDKSNRDSYDSS